MAYYSQDHSIAGKALFGIMSEALLNRSNNHYAYPEANDNQKGMQSMANNIEDRAYYKCYKLKQAQPVILHKVRDCQDSVFYCASLCTFAQAHFSYSSGSSNHNMEVIADYDFYHVRPIFAGEGLNPTQSISQLGDFIANDGILSYSEQGAVLNSNPFTKWMQPSPLREFDRPKWFVTGNQIDNISTNSSLFKVQVVGLGFWFGGQSISSPSHH